MDLPLTEDYHRLFVKDVPLLDTRSPVEFSAGAFPLAENLPLLTDEERHLIGIRYKESGQDAAVALGKELMDGKPKAARVAAWVEYIMLHPEGVLYCFRGGMRSQITQQWIYEATGIQYPRVKGGYKALRNYLLEQLQSSIQTINPIVLGGRTGAGKTLVLKQLDNTVDLEDLAWHRGSAFGRHSSPQPTQIDFENSLSIALLKHIDNGNAALVLEDESKNIGSRHLPIELYERMAAAPLVVLQASLDERIEISIQEYVHNALEEYQSAHGEEKGFRLWSEYAITSLDRIRKRLGGERHQAMKNMLQRAIDHFYKTGEAGNHADWIKILLNEYYDPMYDYQIKNKQGRIIFSGSAKEVIDYLNHA